MTHVLIRTQEACREANMKTFAVFIDYKKAFDSLPRAALLLCLNWAGYPPDLLAVRMATHKDPRGKLCGTQEVFRVVRGVRQGCVLGPAVFILLLEFCPRKADLNDIGVGLNVSPNDNSPCHQISKESGSKYSQGRVRR